MTNRTCKVDDCERTARQRGICATHYRRWRETGVVGGPIEPRTKNAGLTCKTEVCGRPAKERGWCMQHYQRWHRGRETETPIQPPSPRLDVVGYRGLHARLVRDFGVASDHSCVDCGGRADDWSYDNADPSELIQMIDGKPWSYSLDPDHYAPRCATCHIRLDRSTGASVYDVRIRADKSLCAHGHVLTAANTYVNGKRRVCRTCRNEAEVLRRARLKVAS